MTRFEVRELEDLRDRGRAMAVNKRGRWRWCVGGGRTVASVMEKRW
ncbi:hypothetical protein [Corynebacterium phocae]|nr:hypothetical protein [Corynebacterium phocae]